MADPFLLGSLALGGTLVNQGLNRSNMDYQAQVSRELMDYQWKNFNSPKAQVAAMTAAGLNPAAMFDGGKGSFASPSVSMPSSQNVSFDPAGTLSSLSQYLLAKAQAKKAGVETEGTELDNEVKRRTLDDRVKQIGLQNHWTEEQTAKVTQEIGLLSGQFNEIQQRIENMRSEKKLTDKQVSWYDRNISAEIADMQASAEYKKAVAGLTDSQKQLLDDTMEDLKTITNLNARQMEKIVSLLDKYGDAQAIVGMLSQVVGSASDLIGSIASFKNIGKTVETITGSTTQKSDGSWSTTNTRRVTK